MTGARWAGLAVRTWAAIGCAAAGAVLLFVGWWGASGESLVALQIPYLASASIPGAALVVAAAVLLSGRSEPDARVDALFALLTEPVPATTEPVGPAPANGLVTVAGGTRYHDPSCALVAGKAVEPADDARCAGLEPCPVCLPA